MMNGVSLKDMPPMPDDIQERVNSRILLKLLKNPNWRELREKLWTEVGDSYKESWQKSIVDYVLMDSDEKKRLKIRAFPRSFPLRLIRAPVPWHGSFLQCKEAQMHQLFITSRIMTELHMLWWRK
jgi:dynein heavy chain